MKQFLVCISVFFTGVFISSAQKSIHQEQSEYYSQLGITAQMYDTLNQPAQVSIPQRGGCLLNKTVYGWHPYWSNGLQANYQWNLLSHFCYFSYEVDETSGNAVSTHAFATTQSVTDALNNGVKVTLCVTLFSNHATFLGNATSRQTLITNLINLIQARGAHGVNIDFEGLPLSQSANFTLFMNDLANQFHAAIPGSEVSTVLYAVDWNGVINVAAMPNVDQFIIMGYDYYWTGSSSSGPNDPLFHFGSTYNYNLSKSITYYLDQGVPPQKLILGLPYYGREWPVTAQAVPSATTGSGVSRTYAYVKNNSSGFYSTANRSRDAASLSTYYSFNNAGWRHCFISEGIDIHDRLDLINKRGIGGMGIWALGYDDGYMDFWSEIYEHMTDCTVDPCADTLFDIGGGPLKNYYDNEDYTYTIAPANATAVQLNFSSFSLENNFDYLYIYDGPSVASPQIAGSPFTGTNSPGNITSSGGSITLRFTSDGGTTDAGFNATYTCISDNIVPVTSVNAAGTWKTQDFTVTFTDTDNAGGSGVNQTFFQVMDNDGTEWRANGQHGFFNDNFTTTIHSDWTQQTATWSIITGHVNMANESEQNSNLFASVTQNQTYEYLYHWQMNMGGTGTNRRAGIHFFSDDATLLNRGNSYFVYYRADSDKCQIYKVVNDVFTLMTDDDVTINPATWYDCKITFNPTTGTIRAFLNDVLVSSWTDSSPFTNGEFISLRSGGTNVLYDDVKVYRSRTGSESISVGNTLAMVRYQNNGVSQPSCRVRSVINDAAYNWSVPSSVDVNVDWTEPGLVSALNDGTGPDIDTSYDFTAIDAHYIAAIDPHSDITSYEYSMGTTPGDSSVIGWTPNGLVTVITHGGLQLDTNVLYYVNVRAVNGAGLKNSGTSSDGFVVLSFSGLNPVSFINPVSVYPVPARDRFNVFCPKSEFSMTVYDMSGKVWFTNHSQPGLVEVNVAALPRGSYLVKVVYDRGKVEERIIILE